MVLTWKVPYSKADFAKMPLGRLAPHFEIELGLFDDEWEIKNEQLIFNPCSVCLIPWITPLRMVTYDIIVTYDVAQENLRFKFRLFKLYVISMLFAAFPLLGGEIVEGGIVFLACFSFFFIVFFIELIFRKARIRDYLESIG